MNGGLFDRGVEEYMQKVRDKMRREIDGIPEPEIAGADVDSLAQQLMERHQVSCPVLDRDGITLDKPPIAEGARETIFTIYIPFSGGQELFFYSGGSAPILYETIRVEANQLVLSLRHDPNRMEELRHTVLALLERISKEGLEPIGFKLSQYNAHLKGHAAQRIQERRHHIERNNRLSEDLSKTGFALRRRDDGSERLVVPVKAKAIAVPQKPNAGQAEPALSVADYDDILGVIRAMVSVFERSPSVFKSMGEEDLRTILLVALNGIFQGKASGETFNGEGKTDILIRVENSNIFIAECLIWDGPEHFRKKLTDQLFRYATWRDSKLAAIVFNRRADFSGVVRKMKEVAGSLGNGGTELPYTFESGCRHKLRRVDDPQKEFLLTCLAFEVPQK